ncbi:glutamine synthetase family protein [Streptomyces nigrescens]|uniref:Glutamine synthetase family protein n=1 Tax=Streptomyces nigrescens TaxID=1920 RepID=A0ABY7J0C3_STRNI|nr:glutamine synthetase family protein [Streptomyces nigrescens]WAU04010.1 glutamine synthetase family protein [Streptomyces nigrescens]
MPAASSANTAEAHLTLDRLRNLVGSGRIDTVLLAVPDLQGRLKGKRYGARHFLDRIATGGADMCAYVLATDIDMTPADGFALTSWATGYQDLAVTPALTTLRLAPWMPKTVVVLGDAVDHAGAAIEVAPRQMLRRQLARLARHGLDVKAGLECEFVVYQGTPEEAADCGYQGLRSLTMGNLDYALDHPTAADRFFRRLQAALTGAGLPVEAIKTESAPGQVEVTFPYGEAVAACDGHLAFKHAVRAIGGRSGLTPTFMAAPATGMGSGLHLHISLWKDGTNAIADTGNALSTVARHAIAGLVDALPQMAVLYAPNINSYKRYVPDSFAPTTASWGYDNRTCAIRVVGRGEGRHLEIRVPGADANPYLALAAAVAAINHGVDNALTPGPPETGNAYREGGPPLPSTLKQAQVALRNSSIVRDALGPDVVEHYAHLAQLEISHHQHIVTDAERHRWLTRA